VAVVVEVGEITALGNKLLGQHLLFEFDFRSVGERSAAQGEREEQGAVHEVGVGFGIGNGRDSVGRMKPNAPSMKAANARGRRAFLSLRNFSVRPARHYSAV
jgi:hypothetical protein